MMGGSLLPLMNMDIVHSAYIISSPTVDMCPKEERPEYAFIGRSNVGKSSLINMLCNNSQLAKTSSAPGKTQLINHYDIASRSGKSKTINKWFLVDLPGYGYAKISQQQRKKWEKMIEDYLRKRKTLVNIFILVDARHNPQKIDIEFVSQLGQWQLPFTIVFTKADKEKPGVVERNVKEFLNTLKLTWQFLPQHFVTSAEKKTGRNEILDFINGCNKEFVESANEKLEN